MTIQAIREEGNNPDEFLIIPGGGPSKIIPPKKPVETPVVVEEPTETETQKDEPSNDSNNVDKTDQIIPDHNESSNMSNLEETEISINARPEDLDMVLS